MRISSTGRLAPKPGQQTKKCLRLIERVLIRHFLTEGHDLVNRQGTRLRGHEVTSTGDHPKRFVPTLMFIERTKGQQAPCAMGPRITRADFHPLWTPALRKARIDAMPLDESSIQDLVVKFASVISPVRAGKAAEREANEGIAQTWGDFFGEAPGITVRGTGHEGNVVHPILVKAHKYYVGASSALLPSLLLFPEGLEIHIRLRLGGQKVQEFDAYPWAADESLLSKVKSTILRLQSAYGFSVRRTSQMYELQVFLRDREQRLAVNEKVLGKRGENLVELQLVKADTAEADGILYNYRTVVRYGLQDPALENSLILTQLDVNNRAMSETLDDRTWMRIWKHGQAVRERMIADIFPETL